jgi:sugar transferase (PEP-CTERM system associated)
VLRIFGHYYSLATLGLFVCENSVAMLVIYVTVSLIATSSIELAGSPSVGLAAIIPGVINAILMYSFGLYDRSLMTDVRRAAPRVLACVILCSPLVFLCLTLANSEPGRAEIVRPLVLYGSVALSVPVCVIAARLSYLALARVTITPHRILVVGVGRLASEIERLTSGQAHSGSQIVGYVPLTDETLEIPEARIKKLNHPLLEVARESGAGEIVVALSERRGAPLQPLLEARMEGIKITSYLSFWERETQRVNLDALDPSWLIYSDGFRLRTAANVFLKRLLDIVASIALLTFTLPTLILVAFAVRLDSRGPILYRQERVGRYGKTFTIYKFRTMRTDAELGGVPQWATVRDPRITRIGALLRMTRIDELPQIINVLKGEMSFVGPRPERPFFVETLSRDISFYSERHRVRPGITGWAQINYPYGASIEDAKAKLSYDLYYIKNYSFIFDVMIILSTAHAIFAKRGGR